MPCRSGSPQAVLTPWAGLALRAGATFSRTMTARTTPTTPKTSRSRFLISTSGLASEWLLLRTPGRDSCQGPELDIVFPVRMFLRTVLAIAGVAATVGLWDFWPNNEGPPLITGPISVRYDPAETRLTAIVNIQNSGDRPIVAAITSDVFVDSQKQLFNGRRQPQPSRTELASKQLNPVTFILQGDSAAAVWNGVRLMEVTIDAVYDGNAKLNCHLSFMGRFYPELKQIGTVSDDTSPRACRGR